VAWGEPQSRCRCGMGRAPVPVQMWHGASPSPGADVAWGEPQSRCRCGMGRPPVPVQMWHGASPSPGADVARGEPQSRCRCGTGRAPVPVQMWEVRRTVVADAVHLQSVLSHKRLRPFLAEPVGRKRSGGHRLYGYSVGTLWVLHGYSMGTPWVLDGYSRYCVALRACWSAASGRRSTRGCSVAFQASDPSNRARLTAPRAAHPPTLLPFMCLLHHSFPAGHSEGAQSGPSERSEPTKWLRSGSRPVRLGPADAPAHRPNHSGVWRGPDQSPCATPARPTNHAMRYPAVFQGCRKFKVEGKSRPLRRATNDACDTSCGGQEATLRL
jgi:hypothetical protein